MRQLQVRLSILLCVFTLSCTHRKPQPVVEQNKPSQFVPFQVSVIKQNRKLAQQDPESFMPPSTKFFPFFIEATPDNIDARKGDLSGKAAPISADQLRRMLSEGLAPLMYDLSGAYFSGTKSLNDLVMSSAQHIQSAIFDILEKVDNSLTDEDVEYSLVLLPWKQSDPFHYTTSGVQVTGRMTGSAAFGKPSNFYEQVEANMLELQNYAMRDGRQYPVYFIGSIMNIHLKKNASSVKTQILLGLNPNEIPFSQANDQVVFTHLVVPPPMPTLPAPSMSLELHQSVRAARTSPTMHVEFGPLKGWNQNIGSLKVELGEKRSFCDGRSLATPYLKGVLGQKAAGEGMLSSALSGTPVNFYIYDLNMDLVTARVTKMNLAIGGGFHIGSTRLIFGCANSSSIDEQFQGEVNKAIDAQVQKLQNQDPAKLIQSLLDQKRGAQTR